MLARPEQVNGAEPALDVRLEGGGGQSAGGGRGPAGRLVQHGRQFAPEDAANQIQGARFQGRPPPVFPAQGSPNSTI